jgi:hypothetical protein|tara:strand:- start:689 stop:838 length:150 start_codon:yes stop_codon:yes gene_type:complete
MAINRQVTVKISGEEADVEKLIRDIYTLTTDAEAWGWLIVEVQLGEEEL